ncbi:uncharacterized protein LAJ45_04268 [Morchella importuna]|uniref:uncharacterized protein n=1 Tax=Morchella importuna TaxID=1174673 RepID=UPI001E8DF264|nr:uncharacterized protein LAJ45_04268 [Morchella importuna]KAH8151646.1 hypothetical protein LAJ45_04268 [Morchella importuna]
MDLAHSDLLSVWTQIVNNESDKIWIDNRSVFCAPLQSWTSAKVAYSIRLMYVLYSYGDHNRFWRSCLSQSFSRWAAGPSSVAQNFPCQDDVGHFSCLLQQVGTLQIQSVLLSSSSLLHTLDVDFSRVRNEVQS